MLSLIRSGGLLFKWEEEEIRVPLYNYLIWICKNSGFTSSKAKKRNRDLKGWTSLVCTVSMRWVQSCCAAGLELSNNDIADRNIGWQTLIQFDVMLDLLKTITLTSIHMPILRKGWWVQFSCDGFEICFHSEPG